jgi:hypothetical protein
MALWLALSGCFVAATPRFDVCDLALTTPTPTTSPGERLVIEGGPLTDRRDTVVRIGGQAVDLVSFEQTVLECTACRSCRQDLDCGACSSCTDCDTVCDACEERIEVEVPATLASGDTTVSLSNAYGAGSLSIRIVAADDTADTATDP